MSFIGKIFAEVAESVLDIANVSVAVVTDVAKVPKRLFERSEGDASEEFFADTKEAIEDIKSK